MKKLLFILVLLGVSLAGLIYWLSAPSAVRKSESVFTYGTVEKGDIIDAVSATGSVKPIDVVVLSSDSPGMVIDVLAEVNDIVPEGKVLVKLDDRLAQLKLQQAKNGVKIAQALVAQSDSLQSAAEAAVKYQEDLEKSGFRKEREKAELELEAAKSSVQMAKAKLAEAQTQLKQAELGVQLTHLKAPTMPASHETAAVGQRDLLILERNVKVGQMVGPLVNEPLFVMAGNLSRVEVHTEVVEGDIGRIRPGLKAVFTINSYDDPDLKFVGTVKEIRPVPTTVRGAVYYNAVIEVENQKNPKTGEWRLLPGMTASVDVVVREEKDVWKIPIAAVNFQMEDAYQTAAARKLIEEWKQRPDWNDWRPLWTWQSGRGRVWPVFVRINDTAKGVFGIQDGEFLQVLEWETGFEPDQIGADLRVIIAAPPAHEPGILERPANLKLS